MRKITKVTLAFETTGAQLSQPDMAALRRASEIAEATREMAYTIDPGFEQDNLDTLLAGIEHNVEDFADGFIPVTERERRVL